MLRATIASWHAYRWGHPEHPLEVLDGAAPAGRAHQFPPQLLQRLDLKLLVGHDPLQPSVLCLQFLEAFDVVRPSARRTGPASGDGSSPLPRPPGAWRPPGSPGPQPAAGRPAPARPPAAPSGPGGSSACPHTAAPLVVCSSPCSARRPVARHRRGPGIEWPGRRGLHLVKLDCN
jgi:hypothetical protein